MLGFSVSHFTCITKEVIWQYAVCFSVDTGFDCQCSGIHSRSCWDGSRPGYYTVLVRTNPEDYPFICVIWNLRFSQQTVLKVWLSRMWHPVVSIEGTLQEEAAGFPQTFSICLPNDTAAHPRRLYYNIHCCGNLKFYRYVYILTFIEPTSDIALKSPDKKSEGESVMHYWVRLKVFVSYLWRGVLSQGLW